MSCPEAFTLNALHGRLCLFVIGHTLILLSARRPIQVQTNTHTPTHTHTHTHHRRTLVLGLGDKKIMDFGGTGRKNVFKPMYLTLVLIKCVQCLLTNSNETIVNFLLNAVTLGVGYTTQELVNFSLNTVTLGVHNTGATIAAS